MTIFSIVVIFNLYFRSKNLSCGAVLTHTTISRTRISRTAKNAIKISIFEIFRAWNGHLFQFSVKVGLKIYNAFNYCEILAKNFNFLVQKSSKKHKNFNFTRSSNEWLLFQFLEFQVRSPPRNGQKDIFWLTIITTFFKTNPRGPISY